MSVRLGVVVVTYRRIGRLQQLVGRLADLTTIAFDLVVAEDGGEDGSVEWCRERGVRVVTGPNRGVSWNKNRGIFALAAAGCDPILIFEDDCVPDRPGWASDWIDATRAWHHVSYAHRKLRRRMLGGVGTPADPFVSRRSTAQCASISAQALRKVGYLDSRFKGYGLEHKEWTMRIMRAGYGFRQVRTPGGKLSKLKLYIDGGLLALDEPSHRNGASVRANRSLLGELKRTEPIFRAPWSDEEEREAFLLEQREAGIDLDALATRIDKKRRLALAQFQRGKGRLTTRAATTHEGEAVSDPG